MSRQQSPCECVYVCLPVSWHYTNDTWWRVWHANIYVLKLKCQHQGEARVLTFQLRMSHESIVRHLFCRITKYIYIIKNLHFTGKEPYDNYVTTSAGRKYAKIGECEATPTPAPQPMSACDLESRICLHWHNSTLHCDNGLCQCKQSRPVKYLITANGTWLTLDQ